MRTCFGHLPRAVLVSTPLRAVTAQLSRKPVGIPDVNSFDRLRPILVKRRQFNFDITFFACPLDLVRVASAREGRSAILCDHRRLSRHNGRWRSDKRSVYFLYAAILSEFAA